MTLKYPMFFMLFTILIFLCFAVPAKAVALRYVNPEETVSLVKKDKALIVDTMSHIECMDHRIPGSLCMALEEFDKNAPVLLKDKKKKIVFYCESKNCIRANQVYEKAVALGYEDAYVLKGGLPEWKKTGYEVETIKRIRRTPVVSVKFPQLQKIMAEKKNLLILDIRTETEFNKGHIEGAINIPMYALHKKSNKIPKNRSVVVVDENGKRSFIACSYLINNGFRNVKRLFGGMAGIEKQNKKG